MESPPELDQLTSDLDSRFIRYIEFYCYEIFGMMVKDYDTDTAVAYARLVIRRLLRDLFRQNLKKRFPARYQLLRKIAYRYALPSYFEADGIKSIRQDLSNVFDDMFEYLNSLDLLPEILEKILNELGQYLSSQIPSSIERIYSEHIKESSRYTMIEPSYHRDGPNRSAVGIVTHRLNTRVEHPFGREPRRLDFEG